MKWSLYHWFWDRKYVLDMYFLYETQCFETLFVSPCQGTCPQMSGKLGKHFLFETHGYASPFDYENHGLLHKEKCVYAWSRIMISLRN